MFGTDRVGTGVAGLDAVTGGGLPAERLHLIEGGPGTGKTTMALQFLMDGVRQGETVLYVTLSESVNELEDVARSHGWNLAGIHFHELAATEASPGMEYSILYPAEVELGERTGSMMEQVERLNPTRVAIDSVAELALLAHDPLRYRRQILGLKQFFARRRCTVLLLDTVERGTSGVESIAHGVLELEQLAPEYGSERRRMRIMKLRGARYRGGYHDYVIETGGLRVFPRLVAAEHHTPFVPEEISSGLPKLDHLLGGGLQRGTSALLVGPAGVGKSVLISRFAATAAAQGEHVTVYVFDEQRATFLRRSTGLELSLEDQVAAGHVELRQLDPAELSPGEFDQLVREAVERHSSRVIAVDSLNGYLNAMAGERAVLIQLHELLSYLNQQGVLTLLTLAQHGVVGDQIQAPIDVSYLADTVIMLRYFEAAGQLRRAISVVKKRSGTHERTIRELLIGPGIQVGEPLREFRGVLTTARAYLGHAADLLERDAGG